MTGYFEVRAAGRRPGGPRANFRLFCLLDRDGLKDPSIVAVAGMEKPERQGFSDGEYQSVRDAGTEYLNSRRVAT